MNVGNIVYDVRLRIEQNYHKMFNKKINIDITIKKVCSPSITKK